MAGIGGTSTAELLGEAGKFLLLHDLVKDVFGGLGLGNHEPSADPEHKKDQLNEIVVTHFRLEFAKNNLERAEILDQAFTLMGERDEELFSLTVLCGFKEAAHYGKGKTYLMQGETVVSTTSDDGTAKNGDPKKDKSGKKEKTEIKPEKRAVVFCRENYEPLIKDLNKVIEQCKPANGNKDAWAKHLLHRLDENGWISGKQADKIVRWLKKPETKQWFHKHFNLSNAESVVRKEIHHQGEGLGTGVRRITDTLNSLRPINRRPPRRL